MGKLFTHRSGTLVTAFLLSACGTDGFFETIAPSAPGASDSGCDVTARGTVSSIEVDEVVTDSTTGEQVFMPLDEGGMTMIVRGFQGADMIVLALRVTGAGTEPVCLEQKTDVEQGGDRLSFNYVAKRFVPQDDGTSLTKATYFPGAYTPGPATISVSVGGKSLVRHIEVAQ